MKLDTLRFLSTLFICWALWSQNDSPLNAFWSDVQIIFMDLQHFIYQVFWCNRYCITVMMIKMDIFIPIKTQQISCITEILRTWCQHYNCMYYIDNNHKHIWYLICVCESKQIIRYVSCFRLAKRLRCHKCLYSGSLRSYTPLYFIYSLHSICSAFRYS